MQLPDFLRFKPFNQLRQRMGAERLGHFEFFDPNQHLTADERKALASGYTVTASNLTVLEDQTIAYKNSRVIWCENESVDNAAMDQIATSVSASHYHVASCEYFYRAQGSRSNVQISTDAPHLKGRGLNSTSLRICEDCLQTLRFQGFDGVKNRHRQYSQRVLDEFTLELFYSLYPCYPIQFKKQNSLV